MNGNSWRERETKRPTSLMNPNPLSLLMKISDGLPYFEKSFSTSCSETPVGRLPTNSRLRWVYVFSPGLRKFWRSMVMPASTNKRNATWRLYVFRNTSPTHALNTSGVYMKAFQSFASPSPTMRLKGYSNYLGIWSIFIDLWLAIKSNTFCGW